jgi:hypothetical protein
LVLFDVRFGESEISDLDAALDIKENVFQLDVSEQNVVLVKVFQTLEDLEKNCFSLLL